MEDITVGSLPTISLLLVAVLGCHNDSMHATRCIQQAYHYNSKYKLSMLITFCR